MEGTSSLFSSQTKGSGIAAAVSPDAIRIGTSALMLLLRPFPLQIPFLSAERSFLIRVINECFDIDCHNANQYPYDNWPSLTLLVTF